MRNLLRALALSGAAVLVLAPGAVAAATPVDNGCPAAASLLSVAQLEATGPYQLPRFLDDPANGGNGDGWVCGFPLPDAIYGGTLDFTIYQFYENNLPAEGRP